MIIENFPSTHYKKLKKAVDNGGKFVTFRYCVGLIIILNRGNSGIFYISSYKQGILIGMKYTLITLLLGWWFFPTGPMHTIISLITNLRGGEDITGLVLEEAQKGDFNYLAGL